MENRTNYIKIVAYMNKGLKYDSTRNFTADFKNVLIDEEENFRNHVMIPINNQIGLHNWAIDFREIPDVGFFADIYSDNINDCRRIYGILRDKMPAIEFLPYYKGPVANAIHSASKNK